MVVKKIVSKKAHFLNSAKSANRARCRSTACVTNVSCFKHEQFGQNKSSTILISFH